MSLDTNYGSTQKEKDYVKETIDKEGVKGLFEKETTDLKSKIIRNFHNDNYVAFEVQKSFENEKKSMKDIVNADPEMKKRYETVIAAAQEKEKNGKKTGFSEGVLLMQAVAIKCINIINQSELVENKLTSRNGTAFKSPSMDGIMGPNTFYVLASIAKERLIPFNGMVDKKLLDEMIGICGEAPGTTKPFKLPTMDFNKPMIKPGITINKPTVKPMLQPGLNFNTPISKQPIINTKKIFIENVPSGVDEVVTMIEKDPERYSDRKVLSAAEKSIVKEVYQKIMDANREITKIKVIIDGLDQKILLGLKNIIVKKIMILEKEGSADKERFQSIGEMIIARRSQTLTTGK